MAILLLTFLCALLAAGSIAAPIAEEKRGAHCDTYILCYMSNLSA
jgi:hypothetical protein